MNLLEDLKKPINIISLSIAVVSLIGSAVFFSKSQQKKQPTYLVSEERVRIFDSSVSSPKIKVMDENSKLIDDDIFLTTIIFWNSGNLPIEPGDVRDPVKVTMSPCKRILDFSIIEATYPKIGDFKLYEAVQPQSDSLTKNVAIDWKHLDSDFGLKFQIIYVGAENTKISFDGHISGVKKFRDARSIGKRSKLFSLINIVGIVFLLGIVGYVRELTEKYSGIRRFLIRLIYLALAVVIVYIYYILVLKGIEPPV